MLSGVEIAGLVLGAFPLVAKHYRESLKPINTLLHFGRERTEWVSTLNLQSINYKNCLTLLLSKFVRDRFLVNKLLNEEWPTEWKSRSEELENILRGALQEEAYTLFSKIVTDMKAALDELDQFLQDPKSNAIIIAMHKVRVSYSAKRPEMLDRLEQQNYDLDRLVKSALDLQPFRQGSGHNGCTYTYRQIGEGARGLYDAMARSSKHCRDIRQCVREHRAEIRLEARLADLCSFQPIESEKPAVYHGIHCYRVVLKQDISEPGEAVDVIQHFTEEAILDPPTNLVNSVPKKRPKKPKKVNFNQVPPTAAATSRPDPNPTNTFQSFCSLLDCIKTQQDRVAEICLGYVEDESDSPLGIYHPRENDSPPKGSAKSLLAALSTPRELGTKETRLRLALKLVSGILQLHDSPWFPTPLSNQELYLLWCDQPPEPQPFITAQFAQTPVPTSTRSLPKAKDLAFQLTKIMLELAYTAPFASILTPGSAPDPAHPISEMDKARRLAKSPKLRMGESYKEALSFCLQFIDKDMSEGTFNDEKVCQEFYDGVLRSLVDGHVRHLKWP
ncbi:MAG: hypothetical protein M1840_004644 [Geoglossum simile]|nr:MAG: hypothetical protein M1840_004644 [Geoglossum simile]